MKYLIIIFLAIAITCTWLVYLGEEEVEKEPSNAKEDRCEFVFKTSSPTFHISEQTAGSYNYEIFTTPDGFTEVWKCK